MHAQGWDEGLHPFPTRGVLLIRFLYVSLIIGFILASLPWLYKTLAPVVLVGGCYLNLAWKLLLRLQTKFAICRNFNLPTNSAEGF